MSHKKAILSNITKAASLGTTGRFFACRAGKKKPFGECHTSPLASCAAGHVAFAERRLKGVSSPLLIAQSPLDAVDLGDGVVVPQLINLGGLVEVK